MATVTLRKTRETRVRGGHPWIYASEIEKVDGAFENGDIVDVHDFRGKFIGRGFYNPQSQISLRILTRNDEPCDREFFARRIRDAWEYRRQLCDPDSCRLIYSESDFLPGLVVDKYADVLVLQSLSLGIERIKDMIADLLMEIVKPMGIWERSDVPVKKKNLLILNASPRAKGNISQMVDTIKAEALAQGAEVEVVRVGTLCVKPCMGCMRCRTEERCVLPEDDAQRVLAMICRADALVVASPCYWGNIPGTLKLLFDRMVYGLMGENAVGFPIPLHRGKRCALLSTSTTPWPFNILMHQSSGAIRAMKEICGYSGFKIVAKIEKGGTKQHTELSEREKNKCRRAVRRLLK